jgi:anti-sigma factor (TIGR02949 family)
MRRRRRTSCRVLLEQLSAYLDGDLPTVECEAIERHAARCPRCAEVIADLKTIGGLCRRAGSAPLPAPIRQRARERIRRLLTPL